MAPRGEPFGDGAAARDVVETITDGVLPTKD